MCLTSHDSFKPSWFPGGTTHDLTSWPLIGSHNRAGQSASNRHHQAIGKRLGDGNKQDASCLGDLSCTFAP